MDRKKGTLIRGRFRLGENAFPSSREKTERIMKEVDEINKRWLKIKNPEWMSKEKLGLGSEKKNADVD
ncbi:hypothetical protein [Paenibacillus ihuae]|uniref:hypothetical protein n=1 Tax=Paenibacillus ihuae TaxID=1232431 RepID=UPI0006D5A06F|nr:hypothetical protein [Paenibacillus ihuae]